MPRSLVLLISGLVLALGALGCGGNDDDGASGGGGGGSAAPQEPPPASGGGKAAKVSMKNIRFSPEKITVDKGAKVTWTNDDSANHDVTKEGGPGPKFSSGTGNMAKGDTYEQTLSTPGTITYTCKVHPGMDGSIVVK